MARKEYDSPEIKVSLLHEEDVISTSIWNTVVDEENYVVGDFDSDWLV